MDISMEPEPSRDSILEHIKNREWDELMSMKEIDLDIRVCDSMRTAWKNELYIEDDYENLKNVAVLKGWSVTVSRLLSMVRCNMATEYTTTKNTLRWKYLHQIFSHPRGMFVRYEDNKDWLSDKSLVNLLRSQPSDNVCKTVDTTLILEFCFRVGWVDSAEYIHSSLGGKLMNGDRYVYCKPDKRFESSLIHGSMCVVLTSIAHGCDETGDKASRLLSVFLQQGCIPSDWISLLVSAEIYYTRNLKKQIEIHLQEIDEMGTDKHYWVNRVPRSKWKHTPHVVRHDWDIPARKGCDRFVYDCMRPPNPDRLEALLQHGYATNSPTRQSSALHLLCKFQPHDGPVEDVHAILRHFHTFRQTSSWYKKDKFGRLPVHYIALMGDTWSINFVAENTLDSWLSDADGVRRPRKSLEDNMGRTPLHYASHCLDGDIFRVVCSDMQFSIHDEDNNSVTPLQELVKVGKWETVEMVQRLLGPQLHLLDVKNRRGITLIHVAASACRITATRRLLALYKPTDLSIPLKVHIASLLNEGCGKGQTPLFIACLHGPRTATLSAYARFLLRRGASVETLDDSGNNLLHAVAMCDTERVGDMRCEGGGGMCLPILKMLCQLNPSMLFATNDRGMMPLCVASARANTFVVACLLDLGKNYIDSSSLTFHDYVNHKHRGSVDTILVPTVTALDAALEHNSPPTTVRRSMVIVQMLIASGAHIDTEQICQIKEWRKDYPRSVSVARVARMATLCDHSPHNVYQRTWKLPSEILRIVTAAAVRDNDVLRLLRTFNGPPVTYVHHVPDMGSEDGSEDDGEDQDQYVDFDSDSDDDSVV